MKEFILVFITVMNGDLDVQSIGQYDTITQCFYAREQLSVEIGSINGYFPPNTQAVCIRQIEWYVPE